MTDRDALLRAVCESPDDDLPRLVFADWCEEHGEPDRAEFIRLQIGLHADPNQPRKKELARRAQRVADLHGRWRGELPPVPGLIWYLSRDGGEGAEAARSGWPEPLSHPDFEYHPRFVPQPVQLRTGPHRRGFVEDFTVTPVEEPLPLPESFFDGMPVRSFAYLSEQSVGSVLPAVCRSSARVVDLRHAGGLTEEDVLTLAAAGSLPQLTVLTVPRVHEMPRAMADLLRERFGGRLRSGK